MKVIHPGKGQGKWVRQFDCVNCGITNDATGKVLSQIQYELYDEAYKKSG